MAAKASVNVKIDASVKEAASALLASMGIDLTTAVDMFFRQVIAERRLPFQPKAAAFLSDSLAGIIPPDMDAAAIREERARRQ